jgi:hypothetical protein
MIAVLENFSGPTARCHSTGTRAYCGFSEIDGNKSRQGISSLFI